MSKPVKITMNETPTDQVMAKASESEVIKDSCGRSIKLKNPGVLAQYRLVKMIGAESAKNEVYVNMLVPLLWVSEIDGDSVGVPLSEREIEALIQRLGEEGISAIVGHMQAVNDRIQGQNVADLIKN